MSGVFYEDSSMKQTFAIVLSGCGVYDGSEVHEVSAILESLSRKNIRAIIYAPNHEYEVVNHITGIKMGEKRNAMVECSRISRGRALPLASLFHFNHDALIIPGGFGSAKVLSDYVSTQDKITVDPEIARVINEFHSAHKPIGMCCISPVLAAKVIQGCSLTVGKIVSGNSDKADQWPFAGTTDTLTRIGANVISTNEDEIYIDNEHKLITAPGYMFNGPLHVIHDNMVQFVDGVCSLVVIEPVIDEVENEAAEEDF